MPNAILVISVAVAILVNGLGSIVLAIPVPLDFKVEYGDGKVWEVLQPEGKATADDYAAVGRIDTAEFVLDWDISGKYDPTIHGAFAVTNLLRVTQTFTLNVTVPISAIPSGTKLGGSVGGSFTDADGSATATFDSSGATAIYTALIDGASVATLNPSPVSLSVATAFGTASVPTANFGLPGLTATGPALTTDMGTQLTFTLSPDDTAWLNSVFAIVPSEAPEPTSSVMALIGFACFAAHWLRSPRRTG